MSIIKNPIREYLNIMKIKPIDFAIKAQILPSTLSKFMDCIPNMRMETVIKLSEASEGLITFNDIYKAYKAYQSIGKLWNYKTEKGNE